MKSFLLTLLCLGALASPMAAQTPAKPTIVAVTATEVGDSTRIRISWPAVQGRTTYDVITHSVPRSALLEQVRVVTGTSWTISVPRSIMQDNMLVVANVRASSPTNYAAITYRRPVWQIMFQLDTTGTN